MHRTKIICRRLSVSYEKKMWLEILLLLFLAFLFFYRAVTKNYNHFKQHGIPYIEPHFPMGTQNDVILKGRARREMVLKDYKKFKVVEYYTKSDKICMSRLVQTNLSGCILNLEFFLRFKMSPCRVRNFMEPSTFPSPR